ncbi:MAG TPA: ABC transporter permease [Polyangia bacterium]|nr:ABC transporter permease [Polyangia bacterium]
MIRFAARRILAMIPSVIGISLVTFALINLAMKEPDAGEAWSAGSFAFGASAAEDLGRAFGLHLPLFVNFDIADVRSRAAGDIAGLGREESRQRATRSLIQAGGAALPYLLPALTRLEGAQQAAALETLRALAGRIGLVPDLEAASNPVAFWARYWDVYGSDFTPVRGARLVRRLARRADPLALEELRRLDTFCLPQLLEAIGEETDPAALTRLVGFAVELTGREDRLALGQTPAERERVVLRWREWWAQRYDLYTAFDGFSRVSGAITQTRYFRWLGRVATFDFGVSVRDGRTVRDKLAERLPVTLLLSFFALLVAYAVAIPLGVVSAVKRGSLFDRVATVVLFVAYALPMFWVALLGVRYLTGSGLIDLFPSQGLSTPGSAGWPWYSRLADTAHHLVLPVLTLSLPSLAMLANYQRAGMARVIDADFMRTARAKGLSPLQSVLRHGLRNALIPVVTMLGLQLPTLVSGSVVVERIFGIPGMGLETFEAIRAGDHAWLMAVVTVTAVMTMAGVVLADVIYALVDPRIVPGRGLGRRA